MTIAQDASWSEFAIWSAALIVFLLIGGLVIAWVRKRMAPGEADETPDGFTLQGLRELRRRGDLTEAEFQRAKETLIERIRSRTREGDEGSAVAQVREIARRSDKRASPDTTDESNERDEGEDGLANPPQS